MRASLFLALLLAACAFPPNAGDGDRCDEPCAGRCVEGACVAAGVGARCDLSGVGEACVDAAECLDGVCRIPGCEGDPCLCPNAPRCAGLCSQGVCIAAGPGERCDPFGTGPGCSEGTCTDGVCLLPSTPVALEDWREAYAGAHCAWLERCDYWPDSLSARCPDAIATPHPIFGSIAASVQAASAGSLDYDAELAGDCLAAYPARACLGAAPAACDRVFSGSGHAGDACTTNEGCAPDYWCFRADPSGLSCGGTCQPRPDEGDDCNLAPCREGFACVDEDNGAVCRPRGTGGGFGDRCVPAFGSCAPGFYCDADLGLCASKRSEGEICTDWYGCADGLTCAVVSATRAECLPARKLGESCRSHQQCAPAVALVADAQCVNGRCAPLPAFGACGADGFAPNRCDPELAFCDTDEQCRPYRPLDESCPNSEACGTFSEAICSFGACRMPHACE